MIFHRSCALRKVYVDIGKSYLHRNLLFTEAVPLEMSTLTAVMGVSPPGRAILKSQFPIILTVQSLYTGSFSEFDPAHSALLYPSSFANAMTG